MNSENIPGSNQKICKGGVAHGTDGQDSRIIKGWHMLPQENSQKISFIRRPDEEGNMSF